MQDQAEAERSPFGWWHERIQLVLDLDRVSELRETQALTEPEDVGIDRQTGQTERTAADHIARLAAHPRHCDEVVQVRWNLPAEAVLEGGRHPDEAPGFRAEEPGRMDDLLKLLWVGAGQ